MKYITQYQYIDIENCQGIARFCYEIKPQESITTSIHMNTPNLHSINIYSTRYAYDDFRGRNWDDVFTKIIPSWLRRSVAEWCGNSMYETLFASSVFQYSDHPSSENLNELFRRYNNFLKDLRKNDK